MTHPNGDMVHCLFLWITTVKARSLLFVLVNHPTRSHSSGSATIVKTKFFPAGRLSTWRGIVRTFLVCGSCWGTRFYGARWRCTSDRPSSGTSSLSSLFSAHVERCFTIVFWSNFCSFGYFCYLWTAYWNHICVLTRIRMRHGKLVQRSFEKPYVRKTLSILIFLYQLSIKKWRWNRIQERLKYTQTCTPLSASYLLF